MNRRAHAERTAKNKKEHYVKLMLPGVKFTPAIVETHGFLHKEFRTALKLTCDHVILIAQEALTDVYQKNVRDLEVLRCAIMNEYYQRISVATQRAVVN